jgi:hypothetical protein
MTRALSESVTPPVGKATTSNSSVTTTSTTAPDATDSGEEEMPDEDEAQLEEQVKIPEQTTTPLPPSAPKRPAPAQQHSTSKTNYVQVDVRDQTLTKSKRRSSYRDKQRYRRYTYRLRPKEYQQVAR